MTLRYSWAEGALSAPLPHNRLHPLAPQLWASNGCQVTSSASRRVLINIHHCGAGRRSWFSPSASGYGPVDSLAT